MAEEKGEAGLPFKGSF